MHARELFAHGKLPHTLRRLAVQVLEHHPGLQDTVVVGIQPRGVFLARRLCEALEAETSQPPRYGELDVTFHRDDIHLQQTVLIPEGTKLDFSLEGQNVLLVDDVLYTGRTVRAALDAMLAYGRPASVELLVLVDRKRKRHLPINADYVGVAVDTLESEKVIVRWKETEALDDGVVIQSKQA